MPENRTTPAADKAASRLQGSPSHAPTVSLQSSTAERLGVISRAALALQLRIGHLEGKPGTEVLLPIVDVSLFGADSVSDPVEELKPVLSRALTLENVAFVIFDLADDFETLCSQLRHVSDGAIKPEPSRIQAMRRMLVLARSRIDGCMETLRDMPVASVPPPGPRRRPPRLPKRPSAKPPGHPESAGS